ncbi:hypothetical protein FACS1894199_07450 [Bacteroidia bacterium]|nr:hypothetical protein FACS1894195_3390 [Bacteroidia bacterium]GHV65788.1 hypothetical protein FACS1894199_07450 [Bacteroidia bacterium]
MSEELQIDDELLGKISEIFLTYGLRSTSMDDISTYLKMSKKTLYALFKNKDDVVEQVMLYRLSDGSQKKFLECLSKVSPILFLDELKQHIVENMKTLLPSNFFDLKKYHVEVYERIKVKEMETFRTLLTEIVKRGIEGGYFHKSMDIQLQVYLLMNQFNLLRQLELEKSSEYSMPDLIAAVLDNFIRVVSISDKMKEFKEEKKKKINK